MPTISAGPTQPSTTSSSIDFRQFLSPISTSSLQPLASSFTGSTKLLKSTLGFQVSKSTLASHRPWTPPEPSDPLSSPLLYTLSASYMVRHPSGFALVSHPPGCTMDFRSPCYASSRECTVTPWPSSPLVSISVFSVSLLFP